MHGPASRPGFKTRGKYISRTVKTPLLPRLRVHAIGRPQLGAPPLVRVHLAVIGATSIYHSHHRARPKLAPFLQYFATCTKLSNTSFQSWVFCSTCTSPRRLREGPSQLIAGLRMRAIKVPDSAGRRPPTLRLWLSLDVLKSLNSIDSSEGFVLLGLCS